MVGEVFEALALGDEVDGVVDLAGQALEQVDFVRVEFLWIGRVEAEHGPGRGADGKRDLRVDAQLAHALAQRRGQLAAADVADEDMPALA